jgi:beta-aspartyl-dipeptidase (metallo-type)
LFALLRNAEVHAPEPLGCVDLLVCEGRIAALGAGLDALPAALEVEEHDLGGRRLVPGFVDAHVHLTGGGGESGGAASRVPPLPISELTGAGVTSVVGLLGTDAETRSMEGLLAEVRSLREQGLSAWCWTGGYHLPPATLTGSVRGDVVHLDSVIGVGELAISDHRSSQPSLDELLRVASEVHVAGLLTGKAGVVHLHLGDGERGLDLVRRAIETSELPARVFQPTHVNRKRALFDEALGLAGRGCTIDLTAFPSVEGEDELSAEEALGRYLDAGLPSESVTISSDGGGCLPEFDAEGRVLRAGVGRPRALAETLAGLLASGRSLSEVLPAFTTNAARLLRLPRKGRIATGFDADLVVLDDEGLPTDVMAAGQWHLREREQLVRGPFEASAERRGREDDKP